MTGSSSSWKRFALAAAMLAGTVGTIHSRNRVEVVPEHKKLGLFPNALPGWQGQDLPLSPDVRQARANSCFETILVRTRRQR
jgi:hypothetical protein